MTKKEKDHGKKQQSENGQRKIGHPFHYILNGSEAMLCYLNNCCRLFWILTLRCPSSYPVIFRCRIFPLLSFSLSFFPLPLFHTLILCCPFSLPSYFSDFSGCPIFRFPSLPLPFFSCPLYRYRFYLLPYSTDTATP